MCYVVPEFALVFADTFLAVHVDLPPYLVGVHAPLNSARSMASKRAGSKDTDRSETGAVVKRVSASLLIYEDTKIILEKNIKMKWQEVNDAFTCTFGEDLEDHQVYVNIHKSGLYRIACRYPMFPCANMIHWIILHTNHETMTLSSVNGTNISTFRA